MPLALTTGGGAWAWAWACDLPEWLRGLDRPLDGCLADELAAGAEYGLFP